MSFIQLEGSLKFGLVTANVEHGSAVTAITIQLTRATIEIPPTYANAESTEAAGARARSASITFLSDPTLASSFSELLLAAYESASGELKFEGTPELGAVSTTNPKYAGTLIIKDLELLGEAGAARLQTQQYAIKAGTWARTTA